VNLEQWKDLIHDLPCVVCWLQTGEKRFGVEAHHLEADRDELSDWLEIPVCSEHHRGPNGLHGLSRRGFYIRYRLDDLSLIAATLVLAARRDFR
jgi:hypothetical protein